MAIIKFKINQEEHYIEGGGIQNDTTGTTDVIEKIRSGTKAEYDLLGTYDPDTYYIITDEGEGREYIISNTTGTTQKITNIRKGTQAEYDLLGTYDNRCYYIISDKPEAIVNNRTGTTGIVESIRYGTKAEFDLITTKDEKCIYVVDTPQTTVGPGVYHNATLGLISLSSDGENWITIADKNVGATGYEGSAEGDGFLYQRGNNYGFYDESDADIDEGTKDVSSFGPGGYSSNEFWYTNNQRQNPINKDLRGEITDTLEARRGPCDVGYHIPTADEFRSLISIPDAFGESDLSSITNGLMGTVDRSICYPDAWDMSIGSIYRTSSMDADDYLLLDGSSGISKASTTYTNSMGCLIRPFKNEPVTPDDTWTVLYQPTP